MTDSDSSFEDIHDSDDFREHLLVLKAKWKAALKKNKKLLLKCPNYERCQSKCGSVGGMQYHYERCTGNAPQFKCDQCERTYESRTGLNYHMASSHINEPNEDNKSDSPSRPQRSAALNTMFAMHISSNPSSLKQSPTRTPPKIPKTPPPALDVGEFPSPKLMIVSQSEDEEEVPSKPAVKKSSPGSKATPKSDGGTEGKGKKITKYVTIPSIEYPDEYKSFLPVWRQEMKEHKIIKCPNYKDCDFKCTTVNGMKYHYVRCGKANPPEFNCELCGKKFQCRTGLVWHLKKTHKLIDIQPSKGGGFKGTLPAKLVMGPVPQDPSSHPRKKIKLSDGGRENRSPIGHKPRKSFSRRKRYTPHKTPEEILQNVMMFTSIPSPKLGPQAVKEVLVPLSEYHIYENIPTDDVCKPSTVIQLGEEALTWQRMSSESESEGDYNPTELIFDEEVFGGYRSSNSLSDSDDDYMYGASKKKQKQKPNGPTLSVRSAVPRRGRPPKTRDMKDDVYEPISLESLPSTFSRDSLPPPLLTEQEQKPVLPQMPALIKTPDATSDEKSLEPYTRSFYKAPSHVQPPPGLILPVKSEHSARHNVKLPEPPPLLKNASEVADYPHIILPPNPPLSQSWTTTQSTRPPTHTVPALGRSVRPGRLPRSKTGGVKDKKANTLRVGSTTAHFRSSKLSKGQSSSYSMKGMKMTQYEFSPSSSSDVSSHSITNSSPSQSSMVSYGAPSSLQNITAPVQIIQGVATNPSQVQSYQSVQPGGMMLMQGARPLGLEYAPQQSPTYITQDGQTYQIIQAPQTQHLAMPDAGDNSQKVSVIMQPTPAYTTNTSAGGIQYITQLDGPPPLAKTKEKTDKSTLKFNFEEARKQEQAKLKHSPSTELTVCSSTSTEITSQSQASRSSSAEISSEDKMSKQLKMYLEKEVGRKPKQSCVPTTRATVPKCSKGRKTKSISVDHTSHVVAEKSPKLKISPNLFSSSRRNVDASIGIHTLLNNPSSETPVKRLNTKNSTSSITGLFQPDHIQTIKPTDTRHYAETPELGEAKMPLEINFNQSNSNDNRHSSDSGDEEEANGSSSKTRPTKRGREVAASSPQEETSGKGKRSARGSKGKAKTSEDSASIHCEELTEPSPKKKTRSNAKTRGTDKEVALVETPVVDETLMKLGKRSRQTEKPLGLGHSEMDVSVSQLSPEEPLPSPLVDSTIAPSPAKKKRGAKKSGDVSSEPGPSSRGQGKGRKSTVGKKFQCDKCDAEYSGKKSLVNHIASVHDIQLDPSTPMSECVPVWRRAIKIAKAVVCSKCGEYRAVNVEAIKYHWNRCNKDEESFTVRCPHCDKEYRSEAGLKYHLRYTHVSPSPQPLRSPSPEAVQDPSRPLPQRRAATKATKKLAALVIPVDTPAASLPLPSNSTNISTPSPSPSTQEVGVVSITAELRAAFIRKEIVECPHEGCEKTFKTLPGLKYHMARHLDTSPNKFKCPVCRQVLKGVKRFENHVKCKHPNEDPELMNVIDHEYVPGEDPEDSDGDARDDWEAEKDDIAEDSPRKSSGSVGRSHKAHLAAKWVHNVPTNYGGYRDKVREVWSQLYEGRDVLSGEEWTVKTQHWKKVSKSDLALYLPECKHSMPFVVAAKGGSEEPESHTIPLFSACDGVTGAVLYTGGPVWSMDWLPVEGETTEHYVALAAYKGLDETFQIKHPITQPGLLQFWRVGALTNDKGHTPTAQFALGLAHNYGVIRDMKWCPSVRWSGRGVGQRLGVLGVACSDGTVRILVILQPEELSQQFSDMANKRKKASANSPSHLIVALEREAALLVPSGAGISDWSDFGQCLCLDWLPGNKYSRIAAGYSNGVVCVWDLESTCLALPALFSREKGLVIHPMTQLTAHKAPCRTVTWCPHDHNYIFTGGYDKCGCLWDLRRPYSPLEKQEKGMMLSSKWPLLWNEVLFHSDGTAGAAANSPVPCLSYHHASSGSRPSKNLLHCSAPITSVSYCHWSDRVAAGSYSGEVGMVTLPSHLHLSNVIIDRARKKGIKREIVWLNHREPVSPTATPAPSAPPISELVRTHRLVLTPSPGKEVLQRHSQLSPDDTPLQATTKVVWSPNESSYEWMVVGSNTGLVQLLHIQAPIQKPARFFSTYCYQSTVC